MRSSPWKAADILLCYRSALNLNKTYWSNTTNKNPLNKGILTENASGIGMVTLEMVQARAHHVRDHRRGGRVVDGFASGEHARVCPAPGAILAVPGP